MSRVWRVQMPKAGKNCRYSKGNVYSGIYQYLGINGLSSQFCLSHLVNRKLNIHACSTGTLRSHALYTTKPIPPPEYVGPSKLLALDDFNSILAKSKVDVSVLGLLC